MWRRSGSDNLELGAAEVHVTWFRPCSSPFFRVGFTCSCIYRPLLRLADITRYVGTHLI